MYLSGCVSCYLSEVQGDLGYGQALHHYYSMSCQHYTDAVMIMTVKKLSCWFNRGWSHLQSVGEDVSLESVWFLCSRGFTNVRLTGAEELWSENWRLNTPMLVEWVAEQSEAWCGTCVMVNSNFTAWQWPDQQWLCNKIDCFTQTQGHTSTLTTWFQWQSDGGNAQKIK